MYISKGDLGAISNVTVSRNLLKKRENYQTSLRKNEPLSNCLFLLYFMHSVKAVTMAQLVLPLLWFWKLQVSTYILGFQAGGHI